MLRGLCGIERGQLAGNPGHQPEGSSCGHTVGYPGHEATEVSRPGCRSGADSQMTTCSGGCWRIQPMMAGLYTVQMQAPCTQALLDVIGHCQTAESRRCAGVILLMASAGGLFPMPIAPVYAASKVHSLPRFQLRCASWPRYQIAPGLCSPVDAARQAALREVSSFPNRMILGSAHAAVQAGLVHFTRSISGTLAKSGVRLCCLCPQPVATPMVATMQSLGLPMPETGASLLTPQRVRYWDCSPAPHLSTWAATSLSRGTTRDQTFLGMDSA